MDYRVLKSFIEMWSCHIDDVIIRDGYLVLSVVSPSYDLSSVQKFNVLKISFPDRKDFIYYPDMDIKIDNNCRVVRIFYKIEKVVEYVKLTNLEYH